MRVVAKKTIVIVPTYNEAENIHRLMTRILEEVPEVDILVVDDNSPDGTRGIVNNFMRHDGRVNLLERLAKQGLGVAYTAGFNWAIEQGYTSFIQMDADFSHDPIHLRSFLEGLRDHDVVIGSRYIPGGAITGWSWLRQLISRGGNTYARVMLQAKNRDLTGGFVGWRKGALEKVNYATVQSRGYAYQVELKYRAGRSQLKIKEIPIVFENRRLGTSKMSGQIVWEAAFRVLKLRTGAV